MIAPIIPKFCGLSSNRSDSLQCRSSHTSELLVSLPGKENLLRLTGKEPGISNRWKGRKQVILRVKGVLYEFRGERDG